MQYMLRTGRGPEELSREVELPERLREQLESFFDTDLGAVRVRPRGLADGNVAALAGGNIIRFAPGQYRPDTPAGVWTITHEVAHLIQQAASASPHISSGRSSTSTLLLDSRLEAQASHAADAFLDTLIHGAGRSPLLPRGHVRERSGSVHQPLIVNFSTLFGRGATVHHSVTVRDAKRLETIYTDTSRDFDMIFDFTKEMKTTDLLIFNAHGNDEEVDDYNASGLVSMMKVKNFQGCKEVHVYACNCGQGALSFGQAFAEAIYKLTGEPIPVYAPVNTLRWSELHHRFVVDEPKTRGYYAEGSGWNVFIGGKKGYGSMGELKSTEPKPQPKKGGICWFTAIAAAAGLGDGCEELEVLRDLRNNYVLHLPWGYAEQRNYVSASEQLVATIEARPDAEAIYRTLYSDLLSVFPRFRRHGDAYLFYRRAMRHLQAWLRNPPASGAPFRILPDALITGFR